MKQALARIVKTYFKYFAFFYSFLRQRFFLIITFSFFVGLLDALSLSMFIPLFEAAGSGANSGKPSEFARIIQSTGIPFTINTVLLIMVSFFVAKGILKYCDVRFRNKVLEGFARQIRVGLLHRISNLKYSVFVSTDQGMIQNTVSQEVAGTISAYQLYVSAVQNIIFMVVYIGLSFSANPKFTIGIMIGGILSRYILAPFYKNAQKLSLELTSNNHVFLSQVLQQITNFKYLKSTSLMGRYIKKIQSTVVNGERILLNLGHITGFVLAFREPLIMIFIATAIFVQVNYFDSNLSSVLLSLVLFYRGFNSLMAIQSAWTGFMKYTGSIEHIQSFQKMLSANAEPTKGEEFSGFSDKIQLKDVSFSFIDGPEVLSGINCEIPKNKTVALVGKSGSGKTTLSNLISGLLDSSQGQILVDGKPLQDYSRESYRSRIGLISQENVVFNDTLFNNVTFWEEKNADNLKRFKDVLAKVDLIEFLEKSEAADDTKLGDGGIVMSGGQRQRLSIARELYRNTEILILDEATSSLDSQTEKLIQHNIDSIHGEVTLLIIAHRLSTIKNADTILLLENGVIIDQGDFRQLCERSAVFASMVALQEI